MIKTASYKNKYIVIFLILIFSKNLTVNASLNSHHSENNNKPISKNIACSAKDVATFFEKFSNDENIQRSYTTTPLRTLTLDITADPEPKISIKNLKYSELSFPIISSKDKRKINSLEIITKKINANKTK